MKRKIITINEELCDGCGNCVSACSEGALEIIDGKARLVKESFCDGFGDCIGECPTGALKIEEKEAEAFDMESTKEYLLKTRGKEALLRMEEAQKKHGASEHKASLPCGCPGVMIQTLKHDEIFRGFGESKMEPQLRNWPIQIHLLPLKAEYYNEADLLIAADCSAYAYAGFHEDFIKGKTLAIGCPKLDNSEAYKDKILNIIKNNNIKSISIVYMEVPCCMGLVKLVEKAVEESGKRIPLKMTRVGIKGKIC